jgi:hypothetical protein
MHEIDTLSFVDVEERQDAVAIVRSGPGTVALALSLRDGADIECFLPVEVAERLQNALTSGSRCAKLSLNVVRVGRRGMDANTVPGSTIRASASSSPMTSRARRWSPL